MNRDKGIIPNHGWTLLFGAVWDEVQLWPMEPKLSALPRTSRRRYQRPWCHRITYFHWNMTERNVRCQSWLDKQCVNYGYISDWSFYRRFTMIAPTSSCHQLSHSRRISKWRRPFPFLNKKGERQSCEYADILPCMCAPPIVCLVPSLASH